jgi:hypothetical protein
MNDGTYAHQSIARTIVALKNIQSMTPDEMRLVLGSIVTCELVTLEQMDLAFAMLDRFRAKSSV